MVDALKTIELGDDDGHDVLVTSGLNGLAVEADERLACLDHIAHLDKAGKTLAVHFHGAQANMMNTRRPSSVIMPMEWLVTVVAPMRPLAGA